MRNYYKAGTWNAICDVCGFEHKSDELKKRWDGLMVCSKDFETRHPQDLIRVPKENPKVPWARPEPVDVFVNQGRPLTTEADDIIFTETHVVLLTET